MEKNRERNLSDTFKIKYWSALASGLKSPEDWQHWSRAPWVPGQEENAPPPSINNTLIPKNMKRRASPLSRMALSVALEVSQDQDPCYSIFASRHGEIGRTLSLLEDIRHEQPLSPTDFSQSVHNTAAGLFTIALGSRVRVTSLSAGANTVKMAFIEAYNQILETPDKPVQVTVFDQELPPSYQASMPYASFDFAISLILEKTDPTPPPSVLTTLPPKADFANHPELRLMERIHQDGALASFSWAQVIELL